MQKPAKRSRSKHSNQQTASEVRPSPGGKSNHTLLDAPQGANQQRCRKQFPKQIHAAHSASTADTREAAATVGRQIGHLLRVDRASGGRASPALTNALDRLMAADCSTPADALAMLAIGQTLLLGQAERSDCGNTGTVVFDVQDAAVLLAMIFNSVSALEGIAGVPAAAFTGGGPSIN